MGGRGWSNPEIKIVRQHYPSTPMKKILTLLPGRTASAVQQEARKVGLCRTEAFKGKIREKYVNLKSTPELAYILGAILGDGCTIYQKKWGNYFAVLTTTSEKFATSFADAVKKIGLHPYIYRQKEPRLGHWGSKLMYNVRVHSKQLVSFINKLTFPELKKKLGRREDKIAFLRGFYEADGSLKSRGDMSISNSNKELLLLTTELMGEIGIPANVTGPYLWGTNRKPMFLIQVGKTKAEKFLRCVKPIIKCGG